MHGSTRRRENPFLSRNTNVALRSVGIAFPRTPSSRHRLGHVYLPTGKGPSYINHRLGQVYFPTITHNQGGAGKVPFIMNTAQLRVRALGILLVTRA